MGTPAQPAESQQNVGVCELLAKQTLPLTVGAERATVADQANIISICEHKNSFPSSFLHSNVFLSLDPATQVTQVFTSAWRGVPAWSERLGKNPTPTLLPH